MTERERREQGLPLSPTALGLAESVRKDAEEKMRYMAEAIRPALADIVGPSTKLSEALRVASEPFNQISSVVAKQAEAFKALAEFPRVYEPHEYVIPAIRYHNESRTVRLAPDQFDELVKKVAVREAPQNSQYIDLMYDRGTKELYRIVYDQRPTSSFKDSTDNKRLRLLEVLIDSGKPTATKKLAEYLRCSQKQVQNLVQAINAKVDDDLRIPQPLIKANRGSGYYLNKFFCVHPSK